MSEVTQLYRKLCAAFEIPPLALRPQTWFRLPDNSLLLDASSVNLDDLHALTLSCALLKSARVATSLVWEFVSCFENISNERRRDRSLRVPTIDRLRAAFNESEVEPTVLRYSQWRLAGNPLTGFGAAALISAALICGDGSLEVDLSACENLLAFDLAPWTELVKRILRLTGSRGCGIRGLRLDMCPLKSVGKRPEELFLGLQWLSIRQTNLKNLWTVASILSEVSTLRAFLVAGSGKDITILDRVRALFNDEERGNHTVMRRRSHPNGTLMNPTLLFSSSGTSMFSPSSSASGRTEANVPQMNDSVAEAMKVTSTSAIPYLPTSLYMALENFSVMDENSRTPVSLVRHYRKFLLVHAKTALQLLDNTVVTPLVLDRAYEVVPRHFDINHRRGSSPPVNFPQLLRRRELDSSHTRRVVRKPRLEVESTPKRRRNGDYDLRPGSASARSGNLESILRSALESSGHGGLRAEDCLRSLTSARARFPGSNWSPGLRPRSHESTRVRPEFGSQVLGAGFDHGLFEGAFTTELTSKTGIPHVKYLCRPNDRPRQFEYSHLDSRLLVYGTEHGNLIVLDQDLMQVVGSCKVGGGRGHIAPGTSIETGFNELPQVYHHPPGLAGHRPGSNVLGLSWFNKDPNLFISGSENGSIQIYNVDWMSTGRNGGCVFEANQFEKLTSLHANCEDEKFVVSGYSKDVALFDLGTGRKLELIRNCHEDHINVLKFTNHNPNVFVTSSFDRYVKKWDLRERRPSGARRPVFECKSDTGNVMVCMSPDDKYFLVSGVDNEVRQYSAVYGTLDRKFDIPKRRDQRNYTRSYYMNGRDYVISGSCTEDVVRVYNARSGKFSREIDLDNRTGRSRNLIFVQSLRANPRRRHNFSALLSSNSESPYFVIANVDLMTRA